MCPPAPVSPLLDINESWSDEELVRFVAERKSGDPLPQNVLTGVDFSTVDPWNTPENIWYLNRSNFHQPQTHDKESGENGIRKTKNGYWKSTDAFRIPTSTTIVGMKITLEFYEGQAPSGERTGWVMHEYHAEQNAEGVNRAQDYRSLCRVFLQRDDRSNAEEQQISVHADADSDHLEFYPLYLVELEEQTAVEKSQVIAANEQTVTSSSKGSDEQKTHNAADNIPAPYDFPNEDYLEINDLLSLEASSSSSDNSSKRSLISDEYFDADSLLREIVNDHNTREEEEHFDCKLSVAAPAKSDHVVINPSEQRLVQNHNDNVMGAGTPLENSVPSDGINSYSALPSSTAELRQGDPARSVSSSSSQVKRNRCNSSQGSSKSPQRQRVRSIGKFAKIGRKYCCFGSF